MKKCNFKGMSDVNCPNHCNLSIFMKSDNIIGCAGCCSCCLDKLRCNYVCDFVVSAEKKLDKSDVLPPAHNTADKLANKLVSVDVKEYKKIQKEIEESRATSLQNCSIIIKACVSRLARTFLEIGYNLWLCRENEFYKAAGYTDVFDYALKEFGFKRSSVYNFINVCEKFSVKLDGDPTSKVLDSYKQYSFSQLCEILNLSDKQIETVNITPSDSVRTIKEKKKQLNKEKIKSVSEQEYIDTFQETLPAEQITILPVTVEKKISVDFTETQAELLLHLLEHTCLDTAADYDLVDALQSIRSVLSSKVGDKLAV